MEDSTLSGIVNDRDAASKCLVSVVEKAIDELLEADFAEFVAHPREDGRTVVRNGRNVRRFDTFIGRVEVRVPRDRGNLYSDGLPPYRHSLDGLCHDVLSLYRNDMTLSEISEMLRATTGCRISESTIQKIVKGHTASTGTSWTSRWRTVPSYTWTAPG